MGAIAAPSAGALEEAESALQQARAERWSAERLQGRVLEAAQAQTPCAFVALPRPAPSEDGEPLAEAPYRAWAANGVRTVLVLCPATLRLATEETGTHINPDLRFTLFLGYRLLRTADDEVLYDSVAIYRSPATRTLIAWGTDGAQAFRTELEAGIREIVGKILDRLFLAETPATQPAESLNRPGE